MNKPEQYSSVHDLLSKHGISVRLIARSADVWPKTAHKALNPKTVDKCLPVIRRAVRRAVEGHLRAANAQFDPETLWAEFPREDDDTRHAA